MLTPRELARAAGAPVASRRDGVDELTFASRRVMLRWWRRRRFPFAIAVGGDGVALYRARRWRWRAGVVELDPVRIVTACARCRHPVAVHAAPGGCVAPGCACSHRRRSNHSRGRFDGPTLELERRGGELVDLELAPRRRAGVEPSKPWPRA